MGVVPVQKEKPATGWRGRLGLVLVLALAGRGNLAAQENVEIFCSGGDSCVPDNLVFLWDRNGDSVLELDGAERELEATVFIDARSQRLTGWAYGLRHDADVLTLLGSECAPAGFDFICGTDAGDLAVEPFFNQSLIVGPQQGSEHGFISVMLLSFIAPAFLSAGQLNSVAKLAYRVDRSPRGATLVRFVADELRAGPDTPAVGLVVETGFGGGSPSRLVHGKLEVASVSFRRGDVNDSGTLEVTDAINLLGWLFLGGPGSTCLDAVDSDNSGRLDLSDAINVLVFLFGGDLPPGPDLLGEGCDEDPEGEDDGISCESYTSC